MPIKAPNAAQYHENRKHKPLILKGVRTTLLPGLLGIEPVETISFEPPGQGGHRAGARTGGSLGRSRHSKIACITGGSVISAISFRFPWQNGHSSTSNSNTRFISSAQVYLLFRSEAGGSSSIFRYRFREDSKSDELLSGTTRARQAAFGARTP